MQSLAFYKYVLSAPRSSTVWRLGKKEETSVYGVLLREHSERRWHVRCCHMWLQRLKTTCITTKQLCHQFGKLDVWLAKTLSFSSLSQLLLGFIIKGTVKRIGQHMLYTNVGTVGGTGVFIALSFFFVCFVFCLFRISTDKYKSCLSERALQSI